MYIEAKDTIVKTLSHLRQLKHFLGKAEKATTLEGLGMQARTVCSIIGELRRMVPDTRLMIGRETSSIGEELARIEMPLTLATTRNNLILARRDVAFAILALRRMVLAIERHVLSLRDMECPIPVDQQFCYR